MSRDATDTRRLNTTTAVWGGLCGCVVGWIAVVAGVPFALQAAAGGGVVCGGLAAAAPELQNTVVDRRGHLVAGGLAVSVPLVVAGRARVAGDTVPGDVYVAGVVMAGLLFAWAGEGSYVDRRIAAGTVLTRVETTTPRMRQFLFHLVLSVVTLYGMGFLFTGTPDPYVVLAGAVTSAVFAGVDDRELVVLEDGLVVGRADGTGGTLRPWWTVDAVTANGETLRIRQSVPPFPRRRVAADEATARAFVDAARRARRRG